VIDAHPQRENTVNGIVNRQINPTSSRTRCHGCVSQAVRSWNRKYSLRFTSHVMKAIAMNQTALALAHDAKDRAAEASLLHNMGGICWSSDEMQKALDFYGQALAIWETLDRPINRASTLNNIGDVYRRLGDYDRALDYFNRALELRRANGDRRGEAHSLHTIGPVYPGTGEYAKAPENFSRGLTVRREAGDKRGPAHPQLLLHFSRSTDWRERGNPNAPARRGSPAGA